MKKEPQPAYDLINVTKLSKLAEEGKGRLMESDLAIQNEDYLFQFTAVDDDDKKPEKYKIKPGTYSLQAGPMGLFLADMDMQEARLLKTNDNSEKILNEFKFFFERLEVYDELEIAKKRGVLLYGPPGLGKTATISEAARELAKDGDAAIISWNAEAINSSAVLDFFSTGVEYEGVGKLVVILEDLGMGAEGYGGAKGVDRSLLNLLDGSGSVVKVPTFFIATTNYAEQLPEPLVRPGRFDEWIEIGYPKANERVKLVEFIAKRDLTDDEKDVIMDKGLREFSIAHLKEIVVRSKRDGISIKEVVDRLNEHKRRFKKGFDDRSGMGML